MFEEYQICPYTGLRSFTEEESLYFKGRDEDIQLATEQLQRNKFLMLTGASGDGKSSLVYAGIIPNARAGFLKAKYTQWCVADFRPERSPFKNLCVAIAKQLEIANVGTVESELSHGFSALVDFYKNSIRYADPDSLEWTNASDEGKAVLTRRAANLVIIADQFEEFFTNPENYHNGNPSKESNLVVNLLLETAKIALEENLPIYVVFTMRSDYIGQCAAFRGLPEYIGFSQFFVPRLNRQQLQDVIEEPANLSGNRISRRLTERLIHDLTEGVDQLPILQHALNQIWVAANNGSEEMDLIHYAKVGGIGITELPDDQQDPFKNWYEKLPEHIKACYHQPGLQNVLDTHANKMYEMAAEYFKAKSGEQLSDQQAKAIIKNAFTCLTKIDQSRAVRNRMTVKEIYDIMDAPEVDVETISQTLNIFREPGNTIIRPFITEDSESRKMNENEVLDITHESLIRNWELLKEWADEEFDHYTTYQDFYQQVTRWIQSHKSGGFLLPLGTLTHFEGWFYQLDPNPHWVNRYLKTGEDQETLPQAKEIIVNSKDFLTRSAKKHRVTRWIMKVGPKRIAAAFAIIALVALSSFYYNESYKRRNDVVMESMISSAEALLENPNSTLTWKTFYLIPAERNNRGYISKTLNKLKSDLEKVYNASTVGINVVLSDRLQKIYLSEEMLLYGDSVLSKIRPNSTQYDTKRLLSVLIQFSDFADYYDHYNGNEVSARIIKNQNRFLAEVIMSIFRNKSGKDWDMKEVNEGIEASLNHNSFTNQDIDELIQLISPLEGGQSPFIAELYSREKTLGIGAHQSKITYNGLYQMLAYLYATLGDAEKTWACVEKLFEDHPNYLQFRPDAFTVSAYFALNNQWDALSQYAESLSQYLKITKTDVHLRALERARVLHSVNTSRFIGTTTGPNTDNWRNPVLTYLPLPVMNRFFDEFEKEIQAIQSADRRNYESAVFYKLKGTKLARISREMKTENQEILISQLFQQSWNAFNEVSQGYRNQIVETHLSFAENVPREMIYLYPDYREKEFYVEARSRETHFHSGAFMNFILNNNLLNELYPDFEKLNLVHYWVTEYLWNSETQDVEVNPLDSDLLLAIESALDKHPLRELIDFNPIRISIINSLYQNRKHSDIAAWAKKLVPSDFQNLYPEAGSGTFFNSIVTTGMLARIYEQLCLIKEYGQAARIIRGIPKPENKVRLYSHVAARLYFQGEKNIADNFLDSAQMEMEKIPTIESDFWDPRKHLAFALAMQKGPLAYDQVSGLIRNMDGGIRLFTGARVARAISFHNEFYEAYNSLPRYASSDNQLNYIGNILLMQAIINTKDSIWNEFDENYYWFQDNIGFTF